MADTKFMNFAEVTPNSNDSVLVGNSTNGVRRAQLSNLKEAVGATPANCGGIVADSKEPNGFVKFANNFVIQWGFADCDINGTTVQLPTSFSDTNYRVSVCPSYVNDDVPYTEVQVKYLSPSTMILRSFSQTTGGVHWIAVGFQYDN